MSKSTVSGICQAIKSEFQAWAERRLDDVTLDYLFLDASFFRMHPGSPAEPVLAAWGISTGGKPLSSAWRRASASPSTPGTASWSAWATAAWPARCWSSPAAGLIGAIEQAYPKALRQRCLIH